MTMNRTTRIETGILGAPENTVYMHKMFPTATPHTTSKVPGVWVAPGYKIVVTFRGLWITPR